jgi:TolB protein
MFCALIALGAPALLACGGDDAGEASTPTEQATSTSSATALPPATPTEAAADPFEGDDAWIAYQTDRNGEGVWLIHPDATEDHRIAAGVEQEQLLPDWSPDGTRLAFTTRGGETEPLYEYELATEAARQLFACEDPCLGDDEPAYSPDGQSVVFVRALGPLVHSEAFGEEAPADCGLWLGDIASGEVRQLTSNTDPPCDREYNPRWSPDGSLLAYWRSPYEAGEPTGTAVFLLNADGNGERRLTEPQMQAGDPDWSPDGEWIVFSTYPLNEYQCCQVSNLYRIRPDGSGLEQLTGYENDAQRATQPRYTPDGEWIIFTYVTERSRSIRAIPADGGEVVSITGGGIYTHPVWQP